MKESTENYRPWQFSFATLLIIVTICVVLIGIQTVFHSLIIVFAFFVTILIFGLIYGLNSFLSWLLLLGGWLILFRYWNTFFHHWPSKDVLQLSLPASAGAFTLIYGLVAIGRREVLLSPHKILRGWYAVFVGILSIIVSAVLFYVSFIIDIFFGLSHM